MKNIFRFIERVSTSNVPVLICGESGTGKEVVAQSGFPARAHFPVHEQCALRFWGQRDRRLRKVIEMDFVKKASHCNDGIVSRAGRELGD